MLKRDSTGWAGCRSAPSTTLKPWERWANVEYTLQLGWETSCVTHWSKECRKQNLCRFVVQSVQGLLVCCPICMSLCVVASFMHFAFVLKTNPPLKTRSLSAASQGSSSSPASQRKISHNTGSLLGLSQLHRGSSSYSSKRSMLRDHLMEAREVRP